MGSHYLLEIFGVEPSLLVGEHMGAFMQFIRPVLDDNMANVVGETAYAFPGENSGFTALFLLASSHFSIHTWPENGTAAIDMFSCGDIAAEQVVEQVVKYFSPTNYNLQMISR